MRVRTTILLLLLLITLGFVAGLSAVRRSEAQKFANIAAAREAAWQKLVQDYLQHQGKSLADLVKDRSTADGALEAILKNNKAWAEESWDDRTLGSFGANALWVYRRDGSLFYAHDNVNQSLAASPFSPDVLSKVFARDKAPHFFLELPKDAGGKQRFLELRGAPVRAAWDVEGKVAPEGYFVAGRIWDDERRRELAPLAGGEEQVSIDHSMDDSRRPEEAGTMVYAQDWRDWQGRNIARLLITNQSENLAALDTRGGRLFVTIIGGALALFLVLYLLLSRTIVRPLRLVIESLHTENLALLTPLERQRAEFGELARLIQTFFAQRSDLVREMHDRGAAEKALRQSEEMLQHSQKMEAVGRLAGGVAHDFNNLLTAIIGYAELLRQRAGDDDALRQPAELIHQAGEQAAGLTRQLLAFSRKQLLQPKIIDLNVIVGNLHRLLQRIIGEHIEIRHVPEAVNACVKADPGQIEQVVVNLGVNARDAMPRGGILAIRTVEITLREEDKSNQLLPGEYVGLEVTDTGEGMDDETKARIFEPFFTTKGPGKGTGLGLATVYGIVRQSHGGIVVESAKGCGSTFRILLPRENAPAETTEKVEAAAAPAQCNETILIVEDEEIVRELVCEILRSLGYRIYATDRGSEACRILREEAVELDLLISDVVMPEMNGADVARNVHEISPKAKVLFVSGYSESDMADQGLEELNFQVLQKPFTPDTLARKVREVLDAAGPTD